MYADYHYLPKEPSRATLSQAELTAGAAFSGVRGPVMMLTAANLRTVLVTIHASLAQSIAMLSVDAIVETGRIAASALTRDFGIPYPRLALAALNPHAGEGGALGREEIGELRSAMQQMRSA